MRRTIRLMEDWRFYKKGGSMRLVDLPHTWNEVDGQDGGNDYYRGTCIYEKEFEKPEFGAQERVYIQFHGVGISAKVLLNGTHVCTHHNGFSTFRADITDVLQEENLLRAFFRTLSTVCTF